jgi:hypothetical protein
LNTLWIIKTYRKPDILEGILQSLQDFGGGCSVVVCDDLPGGDFEVAKKFPFVEAYCTGDVHGIWANGNRGIKYLLDNDIACDRVILSDNDYILTKPNLVEEFEAAKVADKQDHIMGYVTDADGRDGLEITFPRLAESIKLRWAPGCHGVMLWFTKELLKKVGYIMPFKYSYGYEHSDISSRALMAQGYCPRLFPSLKRSTKFFKLNPQDHHVYDVDLDRTYAENSPAFHEREVRTLRGIDLKQYTHGLKNELVIRREDFDKWSPEAIKSHFLDIKTKKSNNSKSKSKRKRKK